MKQNLDQSALSSFTITPSARVATGSLFYHYI